MASAERIRAAANYDQAPLITIWELTRACDLTCTHCRAEAVPFRNPEELTTEEGRKLLDDIRAMGGVVVVFTGGDPLKRPDVYDLVTYGSSIGLQMTMTPSATPLLNEGSVNRLKAAGLKRLALSLDGADEQVHDSRRGWSGSFQKTLEIARFAGTIGLSLQINTALDRRNIQNLDSIAKQVADLKVALWSVFICVPTGRSKAGDELSAGEIEKTCRRLVQLSADYGIPLKTTAAPQFRRVVMQAEKNPAATAKTEYSKRLSTFGVNDGRGFIFISNKGEVYPSGFLPVRCGSVREQPIGDIYRNSELLQALRDADRLEGKCGYCEYRDVCGGSRARAYAHSGNPLGEDPGCPYQPKPPSLVDEKVEAVIATAVL